MPSHTGTHISGNGVEDIPGARARTALTGGHHLVLGDQPIPSTSTRSANGSSQSTWAARSPAGPFARRRWVSGAPAMSRPHPTTSRR